MEKLLIKLKICGCKSFNDIAIVNKYQPDYVGFVFAESKRKIDEILAKALKKELISKIKVVGVFVNEPLLHIERLCVENIIDVIQLHGEETERYITKLKTLVKQPIIKAVRVQSKEQIIHAQELPCDCLLLDTYTKEVYGGSGESFDWDMIPELNKPYILAGGLNIHNIADAVRRCKPYGIDISSGVERNNQKDEKLVREVVELLSTFGKEG